MNKKVLMVKIDKPAGGEQRLSFSEPIGLCYIAAFLQKYDIDCRLLHLIGPEIKAELWHLMAEFQPDVVGFSVRNFNFNITASFIAELRKSYPGVSFVIGGECLTEDNVTALAERAGVDLAIISDGEEAFLAYVSGVAPNNIPGVAFRTEDGRVRVSREKSRRVDPAKMPMMLRDGLPMDKYVSDAFPGKKYATLHAQRGCRYNCIFCHTACRYDKPLSRTVDQVLEEIDVLVDQYGIEALSIWDEDFFADPERVRAIAQGLIARGCRVEWQTYMKLTDLKKPQVQEILPTLRESGYVRAVVGVESFIPSTLKRYQKSGDKDIVECLQALWINGIKVCPTYIIGEPEETEEEVREGLKTLSNLPKRGIEMDLPYISFITPFHGTHLYKEYVQKGLILDKNMDHYDGEHVVVKSKCDPEVLTALRDKFYRDFYGGSNG